MSFRPTRLRQLADGVEWRNPLASKIIFNLNNMGITINRETCISCGTCVALAPNTLKMDDENKAVVTNETGDDVETIKMAADACPVQAIAIK